MESNRRTNERHTTCGLISSMWDGKSACIGIVDDVSSTGIKVSNIPTFFDLNSQKYVSIVHGPHDDIIMVLRPSWKKETSKEKYFSAGFHVLKTTSNWKKFIAETMAAKA